jgi:hypothetical protein
MEWKLTVNTNLCMSYKIHFIIEAEVFYSSRGVHDIFAQQKLYAGSIFIFGHML